MQHHHSSGNRHSRQRYAKRAIDVALASAGLVLATGIALPIALAIKLDSPGPVIFAQERLGLCGRPFKLFKLRTMRNDAVGTTWTDADDPRVTRVGRVLRRWRLDELPQLWNVLRGEMSMVGPRPIIPAEAEMFGALSLPYSARFTVLPGITGWAQINYKYPRADAEHHEKFRLDLEYVERRSLWLDLWIMLRTLAIVARLRGGPVDHGGDAEIFEPAASGHE